MRRDTALAMLNGAHDNLAVLVADWDRLSSAERRRLAHMLSQYRRCAADLGVVECSMCGEAGLGIAPIILAAVGIAGGAGWLAWRLRGLFEESADARVFHACVEGALSSGEASTVEDARRLCATRRTPGLVWLGVGSGIVGAAWLLAPHIKRMRGAAA